MKRYIIAGIILITMLALFVVIDPVDALEQSYCTVDGEFVEISEITTCTTADDVTSCSVYFQNETTNCPNGCDNVTRSCSPPAYQINIVMIIFGLMVMGLFAIMLKRR